LQAAILPLIRALQNFCERMFIIRGMSPGLSWHGHRSAS